MALNVKKKKGLEEQLIVYEACSEMWNNFCTHKISKKILHIFKQDNYVYDLHIFRQDNYVYDYIFF